MTAYYLSMAYKNAIKTPYLTGLIAVTLGLGIAACTVIFTVLHLMSADPIPQKSDKLYRVQLDNWKVDEPAIQPNDPPEQVTWTDSINLVKAKRATRQASMAFSWALLTPGNNALTPFQVTIRTAHKDIFSMFDMPFLHGGPWTDLDDEQANFMVVISKQINDQVFNGVNSVGQTLIIGQKAFRVSGVLDTWQLKAKFYDLTYGPYYELEDVFMPFLMRRELELPRGGWTNCPVSIEGDDYGAFLASECVNYQLWVELQTEAEKQEYMAFLDQYVEEQRALGRFPRATENRLSDVMQWLSYKEVVSSDLRIVLWLSLLFLLICIINASSLINTKFNSVRHEAGIRRALGASKSHIVQQYLTEAAMLGLLGGIVGLLFAGFGLQGIKLLYEDYQHLVQPDLIVVTSAIALALLSGVLAGLAPIVSGFRVTPAMQLKQR